MRILFVKLTIQCCGLLAGICIAILAQMGTSIILTDVLADHTATIKTLTFVPIILGEDKLLCRLRIEQIKLLFFSSLCKNDQAGGSAERGQA